MMVSNACFKLFVDSPRVRNRLLSRAGLLLILCMLLPGQQAKAGLKVVSVRLADSDIAPGENIEVYLTANNTGTGNESTYACVKITLDGASVERDVSPDVDLTSTDTEFGPYSVTSEATITGGTYTVEASIYPKKDCKGSASSGSASLTVTASNVAPVANADSATVDEDGSIEVDVLANDTDSDGSIDATSVAISSAPINGSVSVNTTTGAVTYSGDSDFNGTDQFTYTVADDDGSASEAATVSLTVNPINDPPWSRVTAALQS